MFGTHLGQHQGLAADCRRHPPARRLRRPRRRLPSRCAACARSRCGSRSIIAPVSTWRAGSRPVPRSRACCIRRWRTDPGHAIWKRDFTGASGLFSIVLKPAPQKAVDTIAQHTQAVRHGFSWGGFESLAIPFDCDGYRTATKWAPGGPTLRLHIGLESVDDLKADLDRGLPPSKRQCEPPHKASRLRTRHRASERASLINVNAVAPTKGLIRCRWR